MNKKVLLKSTLYCLISLPVSSSYAQDNITINGFATIVGGMTLDDGEQIYGYEDKFDLRNESRFALQIKADLGEGLSATTQMVSRGIDGFQPELEWAYMSLETDYGRWNVGRVESLERDA